MQRQVKFVVVYVKNGKEGREVVTLNENFGGKLRKKVGIRKILQLEVLHYLARGGFLLLAFFLYF